ncbi:serine carboxypeptidase [Fomes fomentarius]|nr:serine carboxypeptidase [Fomes fomentarius]
MLFKCFWAAALVIFRVIAACQEGAAQSPVPAPVTHAAPDNIDTVAFKPLEHLHILQASQYSTLTHPYFPKHSVRIKQSQFCDGGVRAYTGYIDTQARHLFFYFFESRRDPDTDDVLLWTNGGPGGSSALGLFMELGPCRVTGPNTTERFDYGWNENANIFFSSTSLLASASRMPTTEKKWTEQGSTLEAADDIAAFVVVFFEHFTKFRGTQFHMTGESYAGRYLPVYASAVLDQNAELVKRGITPINLSSVMIGNGGTDLFQNVLSHYDMQCTQQKFPFQRSISECVRMKGLVPRCAKRIKAGCRDIYDDIECTAAWNFCNEAFGWISGFDQYNMYDATRPCHGNPALEECYPIIKDISAFLNRPDIQATLGVDPSRVNYSLSDDSLNERFARNSDFFNFRAEDYLAALLERGVRVLIYAGTNDFAGSWLANERVTLALEWTSVDEYKNAPKRDWHVDGQVAGWTRSGGGLTFATIDSAGHLAPYDQPERSLAMANRWLASGAL